VATDPDNVAVETEEVEELFGVDLVHVEAVHHHHTALATGLGTHALVKAAAATPRGAKPTILKRIPTLSQFSKRWNYSTTQNDRVQSQKTLNISTPQSCFTVADTLAHQSYY
jgi:hypothetical protein